MQNLSPILKSLEWTKQIIDKEIDQVKEGLPEPTEEDLLKDLEYQKEREREKKT